MEMTKCNNCKEIFPNLGQKGESTQRVRISINGYFCQVDLDLCEECLMKTGIQNLVKKAEEEPEPLLEAIRELVREEIEASRE